MSQILHLWNCKYTFALFGNQAIFSQDLQGLSEVLYVLFSCFTEHLYVIKKILGQIF
jgi:hypothetical protein